MNEADITFLLQRVQSGEIDPDAALERLRMLPYEDLGFAKVDHHRGALRGLEEAIFAGPKQVDEVVAIALSMWSQAGRVIATRVSPEQGRALVAAIPAGTYDSLATTFCARRVDLAAGAPVAVVAAGTADRQVAGEAHNTLAHLGHEVLRVEDCGVAGLHRLLVHVEPLRQVLAIVVVAGMEGALPSVVGGLVDVPVIAVPTSVGYGAAFGGIAALLGMLTSCAQGVTVVNIDNGFGAACAAARIARALQRRRDAEVSTSTGVTG